MPEAVAATELDGQRIRMARRILLVGVGLGVVGAAALGFLGVGGDVGLSAVFVGAAAGSGAAGISLGVATLLDEVQDRQPGRGRILRVVGYLFGAVAALVLAAGAAGGAAAG